MLQFITDGPSELIAEQVRLALQGGVRWVQLRMKEANHSEIIETGRTVRDLCAHAGATFIVNDHPSIAKALGADGVHLGKEDPSPAEARGILGPDAIIGATANSWEDVERIASLPSPVDYIGLGPYRFTGTKKKLAPVLGLEGITSILSRMKEREIDIPVVVIGGITAADIPGLRAHGIPGFAISGAIAHADDIREAARQIVTLTGA